HARVERLEVEVVHAAEVLHVRRRDLGERRMPQAVVGPAEAEPVPRRLRGGGAACGGHEEDDDEAGARNDPYEVLHHDSLRFIAARARYVAWGRPRLSIAAAKASARARSTARGASVRVRGRTASAVDGPRPSARRASASGSAPGCSPSASSRLATERRAPAGSAR